MKRVKKKEIDLEESKDSHNEFNSKPQETSDAPTDFEETLLATSSGCRVHTGQIFIPFYS